MRPKVLLGLSDLQAKGDDPGYRKVLCQSHVFVIILVNANNAFLFIMLSRHDTSRRSENKTRLSIAGEYQQKVLLEASLMPE